MKKLLDTRINKTEIVISAVITVILAIASALVYSNAEAFPILVLLTELGLFTFMTLYITYTVPEKDFAAGRA